MNAPTERSCPSWCTLRTCAGWHWGHVADWDSPDRRDVEIGISAYKDGRPCVVIEVAHWNSEGETVRETSTELSPVQAIATARQVGGQLGVALRSAAARCMVPRRTNDSGDPCPPWCQMRGSHDRHGTSVDVWENDLSEPIARETKVAACLDPETGAAEVVVRYDQWDEIGRHTGGAWRGLSPYEALATGFQVGGHTRYGYALLKASALLRVRPHRGDA